jgi:hypothetical protein
MRCVPWLAPALISCLSACGGRSIVPDAEAASDSTGDDTENGEATAGETGPTGGDLGDPFCLDPSLAEPPAGCPQLCGNGVVDTFMYDGCSETCDTQGTTCEALGYPSSGEVPCLESSCLWNEEACDSCASGGSISACITSELPEYRSFISRLEIAARGDELGVLMNAWEDETGGMLFARVAKDLSIISLSPCIDIGHGNIDLATLEDGWLAAQSTWIDGVGRRTLLHKFDLDGVYREQTLEIDSPANWPRFILDDEGPLMISDGDLLDDIEPMARKFSPTGELLWELELDLDPAAYDGTGAWDAVNDGDGMVLLDQKGNNALEPLRLIRLTDTGELDWVEEVSFPEGPRTYSLSRSGVGFEIFFNNYDTGEPMVISTSPNGSPMLEGPLELGYEFTLVDTLQTNGQTLLLSTNADPGEFRITRYPDGADAAYTLAAGPSGFARPPQHALGETGTFIAWEESAWPSHVKMAFIEEL